MLLLACEEAEVGDAVVRTVDTIVVSVGETVVETICEGVRRAQGSIVRDENMS